MQAILAVTVPFFALVLGGYLAAQARVLPESAIPGLNAFVLYFALPCLLFRFGAGMPVLQLLDPRVLAVYLPVAGLMIVFTLATTRSQEASLKDAAFGALVGAFPNTGFMGVPLLVALLGPQAAGPVICTVLVDLFFTSSVCIALAQAPRQGGAGAAVLKGLRGALSNPLPWAIALGVLASAAGARLPGPLESVVRMLADAASPVALFTIGAVLWRGGRHAHSRTPWARFLPVALTKLVVHPLLVALACVLMQRLGVPLAPFTAMVLVLAAALPSASNVAILAERYGADNGRVARIILASTVLSFGSFSLLAWGYGVRPAGWKADGSAVGEPARLQLPGAALQGQVAAVAAARDAGLGIGRVGAPAAHVDPEAQAGHQPFEVHQQQHVVACRRGCGVGPAAHRHGQGPGRGGQRGEG
jgi:malonate transporter and related proteins